MRNKEKFTIVIIGTLIVVIFVCSIIVRKKETVEDKTTAIPTYTCQGVIEEIISDDMILVNLSQVRFNIQNKVLLLNQENYFVVEKSRIQGVLKEGGKVEILIFHIPFEDEQISAFDLKILD